MRGNASGWDNKVVLVIRSVLVEEYHTGVGTVYSIERIELLLLKNSCSLNEKVW